MSQLIKTPELAGTLREYLAEQTGKGHEWVVYDADNPIGSQWDLHCFPEEKQALDFAREYQQIFNWHIAVPMSELLYGLKELEYSLKDKNMNRNSLENFRAEAKALKVPEEMIEAAVKQMEQNLPRIAVYGQIPADRGKMDLTIHLKQSGQSDFYYFNKFDLAQSKARPLEKDHQYMVISPNPEKQGENLIKKYDSAVQAMDFFKAQKGVSELAIGKGTGKDLDFRDTVATMKDGKIDYVKKEFQQTFYSPALKNSHYVDRGKGFSVEQAANMLQGRAVFRDDMVSRAGEQYKAWNIYLFDKPKDKYGNYTIKQFGQGYGFDLKKDLENHRIKELDNREKFNAIMAEMKEGNRPNVTAVNDKGEEMKLKVQAMPRFGNLNFYHLNGKPENREQFQKVVKQQGKNMPMEKHKSQSATQEMSM